MALNATDISIIKSLIDDLKTTRANVNVVCFGYPDLLMTSEHVAKIFGEVQARALPRRDDSFRVAVEHGFRMDLVTGVYESIAFFRALGAQLTIIDAIPWTGSEFVADLNFPISDELKNSFDIVIDPGALEHVFNVAQGFKNAAELTKIGGYIFHSNPMAHVNHGFYGFSPTLYSDFYSLNGFKTHWIRRITAALDSNGFVVEHSDVDLYAVLSESPIETVLVLVQKMEGVAIRWPIQTIYGGGESTPKDFERPAVTVLPEGFSFSDLAVKRLDEKASPRWRDLADQIVEAGLNRCAICCAGQLLELVMKYLQERQISVSCVIDQEQRLWGRKIRGVPIISMAEAIRNGETHFYIASQRFHEEIKQSLRSLEPEAGAFKVFSWE